MHSSAPWIRRLWLDVVPVTAGVAIFYHGPYLRVWTGALIPLSFPIVYQYIERRTGIWGTDRMCGEQLLDWFNSWIPRKYRSEALVDLREDISDMRGDGLSEEQINRRVIWQLFWLLLSHWKVWTSAGLLWLYAKVRELLGE